MPKFVLPFCLLLSLFAAYANAQKIIKTGYSENPFCSLKFMGGATDTITFVANYEGSFGPLSAKNAAGLEVIEKLNGLNTKKFKYSIAFTIGGFAQKFYAPSLDNDFYATLSAKQGGIKTLQLKCIVYRFYTLDGITNFFYINKAQVADKSI